MRSLIDSGIVLTIRKEFPLEDLHLGPKDSYRGYGPRAIGISFFKLISHHTII